MNNDVMPGLNDLESLLSRSTPSQWHSPASISQRIAEGKAQRKSVARTELAQLNTSGRDPLGILNEQNQGRVPDLVPIRTERMSLSEFAFYRGGAAIMAADLATTPHSNILVPSCGDAHVSNFGFYASPMQTLVFDLNDFDEAAWAPWEWDLKRLIASLVIAGKDTARDEDVIVSAVRAAVRSYALAIRNSLSLSPRARYLTHFDANDATQGLTGSTRKVIREATRHARKRTGERAVRKLTVTEPNGRLRFVEHQPTMQRASATLQDRVHDHIDQYLNSAPSDIKMLMRHYTVSDIARRVVGVGSVGTRCALVLLQDGDQHGFILQAKEASISVLAQYGGIEQPEIIVDGIAQNGEGSRVVSLQKILQGVSDPFLGYLNVDGLDYYIRQFHDMKGSIEAVLLDDEPFVNYAAACGVTLARAHSQSPQASRVSGYVGNGRLMADLLIPWAFEYAELSHRDYQAFTAAASAAVAAQTL